MYRISLPRPDENTVELKINGSPWRTWSNKTIDPT